MEASAVPEFATWLYPLPSYIPGDLTSEYPQAKSEKRFMVPGIVHSPFKFRSRSKVWKFCMYGLMGFSEDVYQIFVFAPRSTATLEFKNSKHRTEPRSTDVFRDVVRVRLLEVGTTLVLVPWLPSASVALVDDPIFCDKELNSATRHVAGTEHRKSQILTAMDGCHL